MADLKDHKTGVKKSQLSRLREAGLTVTEIAFKLHINQTDVTRLVAAWGLKKIDMNNQDQVRLQKSMEVCRVRYANLTVPMKERESDDIMTRAKEKLGARLVETIRGYLLDGRPATIWQICGAAGFNPKRKLF